MIIAWKNFLDDAVTIPSSVATNRDIEDLKIPHLTRTFSFSTNSGNIIFDLGEDRAITCFILGGTNLLPADTITLEANDSDEWTSPSYSQSVNYYEKNQLLFLNETYRYWRVVITSSVDMVKIGHIFIGQYIQLPPIKTDVAHEHNRTDMLTINPALNVYGDIGYQFYSAKFTFPHIRENGEVIRGKTVCSRSELLNMWNTVGSIKPIYLCIWENDLEAQPPIFGIINQSTMKLTREEKYKSYKVEINFQEVR